MKIIIHRGADKIGGNCIEISSEKARILLDFGYPLDWNKKLEQKSTPDLIKDDILSAIEGVYDYDTPKFDVVFLSHYHLDHFGFLSRINEKIPIYASKISGQIICIYSVLERCEKIAAKIKALERFNDSIKVGDLEVEAVEVKHSAAAAYSFIITQKGSGNRIFYSGDFLFNPDELNNSELADKIKNVDIMIVEGTNIDSGKEQLTEDDVYEKIKDEISKNDNRLIFISFSRSNVLRWGTLLNVIKETGRILVLEPYGALILEFLAKELNIDFNGKIKVFFESTRLTSEIKDEFSSFFKKMIPLKISAEEMRENPSKYIVADSFYIMNYYERYFKDLKDKPLLIYSLWNGYFDDEQKKFWEDKTNKISYIHSSGHIYEKELIEFVNKVKPKTIIPVHTNNPQKFKEIFNNFNVKIAKNMEEIVV